MVRCYHGKGNWRHDQFPESEYTRDRRVKCQLSEFYFKNGLIARGFNLSDLAWVRGSVCFSDDSVKTVDYYATRSTIKRLLQAIDCGATGFYFSNKTQKFDVEN